MNSSKHFAKALYLFVTIFLITVDQSYAMYFGHQGNPYVENEISWQPIRFEDDDNSGFKAAFPGEPRSGISTPWYFVNSKYQETIYEIHTHMNHLFDWNSEDDFIDECNKAFASEYAILSVAELTIPHVKKCVEILKYDSNSKDLVKILRIYWTADKRLYYAIIEGKDFSLVSDFFNKIQFNMPKKPTKK